MALLISIVSAAAYADEPTLLLYGDSLLAGLGLSAAEGFEGQLRAALAARGAAVSVVNASVSGDTTADGLDRLAWTLGERPDAVILGLGANDMLRGLPVEETRTNLDAMLEELTSADLPVLLLGMKADRGLGADYVEAFDQMFSTLAERHGVQFYPFYLEAIGLDAGFYQQDLRHPNAEGVARIVADVLPQVEALVDEIPERAVRQH
ncbi:MAG: arylesterase [Geminicoccaceae bacterium]